MLTGSILVIGTTSYRVDTASKCGQYCSNNTSIVHTNAQHNTTTQQRHTTTALLLLLLLHSSRRQLALATGETEVNTADFLLRWELSLFAFQRIRWCWTR
jgi:hypothetical protein